MTIMDMSNAPAPVPIGDLSIPRHVAIIMVGNGREHRFRGLGAKTGS